jgi:hypothetical protein
MMAWEGEAMSDTGRLPEEFLQSPLGRALIRIFGRDRLERFNDRMDEEVRGSERPQGEHRCPWVVPTGRFQCIRRKGHEGLCRTERAILDKRADKWFIEPEFWRGINYDIG